MVGLDNIGFIQGRLSPLVNGMIQAFPWQHWREEFTIAKKHSFSLMEWTLDQEDLYKNPLMTKSGQEEILLLCKQNKIRIPALTGDCFMQAPFYKSPGKDQIKLIDDFINIVHACGQLKINYIVFPLVDNGALETKAEEEILETVLRQEIQPLLKKEKINIIFESDYSPKKLKTFIEMFDPLYFGINYDMGNSASLGYDPDKEFSLYGNRIYHVHVKDRVLHGGTVPLGKGNVDFDKVFRGLNNLNYSGYYMLQTARAKDNNHAEVLCQYREQVKNWI